MASRFLFSRVSPELIKSLRDATGAPLNKCKEALEKFSDMGQARQYLKEKNLIFADKKAGNECKQGVLSVKRFPEGLLVTSIMSETDFVSKNSDFLNFAAQSADVLSKHHAKFQVGGSEVTSETLQDIKGQEESLLDSQKQITARIQEKIQITRVYKRSLEPNQVLGLYQHGELQPGISPSIAYVVLEVEGECPVSTMQALADDLAVLAYCKRCSYLSLDDVPKEEVAQLKAKIEAEEAQFLAKKPEEIRKQIVQGKIMKHFGDELLLEQIADFHDSETRLADYLRALESKHKAKIRIRAFKTLSVT